MTSTTWVINTPNRLHWMRLPIADILRDLQSIRRYRRKRRRP